MKQVNEYLEFKELLKQIKQSNTKPTLLLHSCCGPCSSYVLTFLHEYFDITIYYTNSNIYPKAEFDKRLATQKEIIEKLGYDIEVIEGEYNYQDYLNSIKGYETLGEGSLRCYNCYDFRIKETSVLATKLNFDYYTTTLSISPYKNSDWINELGKKYEDKAKYLYSNFKKEDGYKKSIQLSYQYEIYRQDYCGCAYSILEHQERMKKGEYDG